MTSDPASAIHVPEPWEAVAETVLRGRRRIMVIGATDSGKSTFCRFLADRVLAAGLRPALVDADVGQKAIGPPAAVTLGYPTADTDGWPAPAALHFVGSTSPAGFFLPVTLGTARLAALAVADIVIVNTTGMIRGPGVLLKSYKIEAVRPDLVVAIAHGDELAPILAANGHVPAMRITPSQFVRTKGRAERDANRAAAFARHFAGADRRRIAWSDFIVQPSVPAAMPHGLLCGIADGNGDWRGLGMLAPAGPDDPVPVLTTPVPRSDALILRLGALRLTDQFRDKPL